MAINNDTYEALFVIINIIWSLLMKQLSIMVIINGQLDIIGH